MPFSRARRRVRDTLNVLGHQGIESLGERAVIREVALKRRNDWLGTPLAFLDATD